MISHLHGLFLSPLPCCPHSRSISEFFSEVQPGIVRYAAWYAAAGKISDYLTIPWDILRHERNDSRIWDETRPVSRWSNQHAGASRGGSAHGPYGSYGYYMDHVDLLWSFSCVSFSKRVVFRVFFLWNIWFLTSVSFLKIGHLIFMKHLIVFKWNSSSYCILYHIISWYMMVCFSGGEDWKTSRTSRTSRQVLRSLGFVVQPSLVSEIMEKDRRMVIQVPLFLTCQSCHVQISGATNI